MTPTLSIVDDEKTQREGLREALQDRYDVYLAQDAKAAMELLEKEQFDVLLTDFRLPTEDGMKLIARAESLSKPPICILMTAYGSEELAVEAMKRGARILTCPCRAWHPVAYTRPAREPRPQSVSSKSRKVPLSLRERVGVRGPRRRRRVFPVSGRRSSPSPRPSPGGRGGLGTTPHAAVAHAGRRAVRAARGAAIRKKNSKNTPLLSHDGNVSLHWPLITGSHPNTLLHTGEYDTAACR